MKLWLATSNTGKVKELKTLLHSLAVTIHTPHEISTYHYPEETGESFLDNALIKAKALKSLCSDDWVMAEDSGLIVEGLNQMPGVHSARYAGNKATDAENMAKVLKMLSLRSPQNRSAYFKCAMIAISPQGKIHNFEGEIQGQISKSAKGSTGFGYDPIFIPEGESKSFAELGPAFKNKVSHRKIALQQFIELLKKERP